MTWKTNPTSGHVAGELVLRDGTPLDQVELTLDPVIGAGPEVTRLSDGSGWFGFVDVESGLYFVKADLPDGSWAIRSTWCG
jgi:hypothetical protein